MRKNGVFFLLRAALLRNGPLFPFMTESRALGRLVFLTEGMAVMCVKLRTILEGIFLPKLFPFKVREGSVQERVEKLFFFRCMASYSFSHTVI